MKITLSTFNYLNFNSIKNLFELKKKIIIPSYKKGESSLVPMRNKIFLFDTNTLTQYALFSKEHIIERFAWQLVQNKRYI